VRDALECATRAHNGWQRAHVMLSGSMQWLLKKKGIVQWARWAFESHALSQALPADAPAAAATCCLPLVPPQQLLLLLPCLLHQPLQERQLHHDA